MLTEINGTFVKIAWASDADVHLMRGSPDRPAARFNRVGQDALYLSPDAESARVAIGGDVRPGDPDRVLLTFDVGYCRLFDLRDPGAEGIYRLARQPWRQCLASGDEPVCWQAADQLRQDGYAGLIDPSRRRPGLWHITLFCWNEPGAPTVHQLGQPEPIDVQLDYR